jgi:N-acetylglucosaminyldiphosphoundecaprenol N-acetyl-beta-D-mannosaminyltransferase
MAAPHDFKTVTILGIRFFTGTVKEAVDRMMLGGLLLVPAAPALKDLQTHPAYREALLSADVVIPDSAFMVLLWNRLQSHPLSRVSGLEYMRDLLRRPEVCSPGTTLWVMAGKKSASQNLHYLAEQGIQVPESHVYMAPMYGKVDGSELADPELLEIIERLKPAHVVITVGGGTQERLGLYLARQLSYKPGIHCIGAAIAFLSGDQVYIPVWADQFYLGWLFRVMEDPKRYGPRYWGARSLFQLMVKYRDQLPPALPPSA